MLCSGQASFTHEPLLWFMIYFYADQRYTYRARSTLNILVIFYWNFLLGGTLESVIDVGQGISVGPGKFDKKNKRRALNTHVLCSK